MAVALLLHAVVTGVLALVFSGLVTTQWLLARLSPGREPAPPGAALGDAA